jgi:hypothetical protein
VDPDNNTFSTANDGMWDTVVDTTQPAADFSAWAAQTEQKQTLLVTRDEGRQYPCADPGEEDRRQALILDSCRD